MQRCYCGHSGGSFAGSGSSILKSTSHIRRLQQQSQQQLQPRRDQLSLTSSSRQSMQPTQFVKRPSVKRTVELGLGHSNSELSRDFSRRNSATTTLSHCDSSCAFAKQQQRQQRESRVKVLSWGTGERHSSSHSTISHCEHTGNRRNYEQRACVASHLINQGQVQVHTRNTATPSPLPPTPNLDCTDDMQRLLTLQQFRLLNASDCFSVQRQDELRLQRAYDKLTITDNVKGQKNKANECRQAALVTTLFAPTPYALRQKLLQLQLQEEHARGRGSGALCAPLERSCALRFNCQ